MERRICFLTLLIWSCGTNLYGTEAVKGVIDLRKVDLENTRATLDGEWEFYWEKLLSPDEFSTGTQPVDYYHFPALWNDGITQNGTVLTPSGYATYRLIVFLPKNRPVLGFMVHPFYNSYRLYINGVLELENGMVGTSKETSSAYWLPKRAEIKTGTDTLEVVLQISNYRHVKGGAGASIYLSRIQRIEKDQNLARGYDLILFGCLIMTGLFFLGLYLFGERERPAIFFSLFCLTFAYRIIGTDDYSLQSLYPEMSWLLTARLEYLSLFVPPIFFGFYTHFLYPKDSKFLILPGLSWLSAMLAIFTFFAPIRSVTYFIDPYLIVLLFGIGWAAIVYLSAAINNRDGARFALAGIIALLGLSLHRILSYFQLTSESEFFSFLGHLLFFFFQSLILFFMFTKSLRRAKEEAEHAARTKSDFLSMMSHEIRTPMNAVIGMTNYLIGDQPKKKHLESLNTLKFSAQNLMVIINDILDFSKIEAEKIEFEEKSCSLKKILTNIQSTFEPIAKEKGLNLVLIIDESLPDRIICDPTRTSQVFSNLVSNSLKFTSEGEITVTARVVNQSPMQATINFSVEDTGIGIPLSMQTEIFKSFTQASTSTTRKYGGTGLGLTITKKLLELQGVELKVKSEEGKGSMFYFTQTYRVISEDPVNIVPLSESKDIIDAKILLVEDNMINQMVAVKFLKKWGAIVSTATNGQEALQKFETSNPGYDLILMDLQMPTMDGYEASRKLRQKGLKIPIIALTASALLDDKNKILNSGMNDYVLKPFDPEVLLKKIMEYT